ncbi:MAG: glycosyltransferase family 2 protein [Pseudomonadota bacterium]|nr:glycosyltransferase family 2 protein [Pseudomonadota bacterium]
MSRVSVVIPCYDSGATLDEAVQSALAQTWDDLEVVVVDDGSTDPATVALLDGAAWPRTRIIRQANAGPAAARNAAIGAATGEYVLPLDADDRIAPTYVEKAHAVLQARPEVGIVYCKAEKFGAASGAWELPAYSIRELAVDNVIFVTSLFRRADWEHVGGFNEQLRHGVEDYDFWLKLVGMGREVVQLEETLFQYRVQSSSRTTGFSADRAGMVDTYARIFRDNIGFFAQNAETLFEHRFALYDELGMYRARYGRLEALLRRHPALARIARWVSRLL